jgi:hypothetical protein
MMFITDQAALEVLLVGNTHFITLAPGKEAAMFFETASRAHMAMPDGSRREGNWRLTATGYSVDWSDGSKAAWQIQREPGRIAYCDAGGAPRGEVTRIVPGDAVGFAA